MYFHHSPLFETGDEIGGIKKTEAPESWWKLPERSPRKMMSVRVLGEKFVITISPSLSLPSALPPLLFSSGARKASHPPQ
jgi:hypothetical protein